MLALIAESGFVRVAELSGEFGVSEVTVRRDLDALEAEGGMRRVHGGAMPCDAARLARASRSRRRGRGRRGKAAHRRRGGGPARAGMSVFLDVGHDHGGRRPRTARAATSCAT